MALSLENAGKVPASDPYFNLGDHKWQISTNNSDAQEWFNRGLVWAYSFNHREAAACFEQVVAHDPNCAMGYWGVAFVSGPNYNKVWAAFDEKDLKRSLSKCYQFCQKAKEVSSTATPVEQALVSALLKRFPKEAPEDFTPYVKEYAHAMIEVHKQFGNGDLDIITLSADALMNATPWQLYEAKTGNPNLSSFVFEVEEILGEGIKLPKAKFHPGILHLYIHLVEMSKTPERGIIPADHLRSLVPDGGHMHHMPSHIDVLIGDYRRALHTNLSATIADDKYYKKEGGENFYSFYRMHNYHSLIYAAMMAGQADAALEATSRMEATITESMLMVESPPLADWLEFFKSVRVHVLIRFGKWEELKKLPIPENPQLYCVTAAFVHYGKGIAFAATGDVKNADIERELFRAAALQVPATRLIFPNKVSDILKVATAMLDGEIEYRRGDYDVAFESLRLAISHEDALVYAEPWAWMLPTRHPYAALSLEQQRVEEAAKAYAEDLGLSGSLVGAHRHPNNVWALHRYHECLVRLGRTAEAEIIKSQLTVAAAGADIPVESSCFCRLETVNGKKTVCCSSMAI